MQQVAAPRRATLQPNQRYPEQGRSQTRLDTVPDEDEYYADYDQARPEDDYEAGDGLYRGGKKFSRNDVMDLDF